MFAENRYRPRAVLAYVDSAHAARTSRVLRRHGWEVHQVGAAAEARRLVVTLHPDLVILDARLPDESGWLACAKLRVARPGQKVILVDPDHTPHAHRFGQFVGAAAVISREDDLSAYLEENLGARVPA